MKKIPVFIAAGFLAVIAACYFLINPFQEFIKEGFDVLTSNDQQRISAWVSQFGLVGPVIIILIMVVQMFLFVVPNIFVMMVAIIMYGPVWGAILALLGVFASSSVGYMIGRSLGPVTVDKLMSQKTRQKTTDFVQTYGVMAIAITRLSSLSNDSLSIIAGLLRMSYKKYIIATLAGITPLIVLLAIYGKNGKILTALIWIALISLAVLIIYVVLDKKRKQRIRRQNQQLGRTSSIQQQ